MPFEQNTYSTRLLYSSRRWGSSKRPIHGSERGDTRARLEYLLSGFSKHRLSSLSRSKRSLFRFCLDDAPGRVATQPQCLTDRRCLGRYLAQSGTAHPNRLHIEATSCLIVIAQCTAAHRTYKFYPRKLCKQGPKVTLVTLVALQRMMLAPPSADFPPPRRIGGGR
jgi:hypothetical protein